MPGLEPLLAEECRALGFRRVAQGDGGVSFEASVEQARVALRSLGLAQHLLWRLGTFEARHLAELRRKAGAVPWGDVLRSAVPRRYVVHASRSKLYHTEAIRERVEAAIAEALADDPQPAKAPGEAEPGEAVVHVRVRRDKVTLSLDLAGQPLWRRGYRQNPGRAPLREDLARAVLRFVGVGPGVQVIDPMFGSGTLLIEGAMLEAGLEPGARRGFALYNTALAQASEPFEPREVSGEGVRHLGGDHNPRAVDWANDNAERAGVRGRLDLRTVALSAFEVETPTGPAALVANPPYGKRLREADLAGLFGRLGALYKGLPAGTGLGVLAPREDLLEALGVDHDRKTLPHGGSRVFLAVRAL